MIKNSFSTIFGSIRACTGYFLVGINTLFIMLMFTPIAWVKKYSSNQVVSRICLQALHKIGKLWIINNYLIVKLIGSVKWEVEGYEQIEHLPADKWYLLISNHQSWNDVFILQFLLNRKLPFQKYLVKEKMRKFPVMGFVWESIDCPFLRRTKINPEMLNKNSSQVDDIENIKNKCKKFKLAPATIAAFVEGTRFTEQKHAEQQSPYKNLLAPKSGGIAAILEELHNEIKGIIDVSISYTPRAYSFWDLFAGNIKKVSAKINFIDIPDWLLDKYKSNTPYENYRDEFQAWINSLWVDKDQYLARYY